jgi:hypothetical protein
MKFTETFGAFGRRTRAGGTRKPLRTLVELCKELGIPDYHSVLGKLKLEGAPKPELRNHNGSWYAPTKFKRWYKSVTTKGEKK